MTCAWLFDSSPRDFSWPNSLWESRQLKKEAGYLIEYNGSYNPKLSFSKDILSSYILSPLETNNYDKALKPLSAFKVQLILFSELLVIESCLTLCSIPSHKSALKALTVEVHWGIFFKESIL